MASRGRGWLEPDRSGVPVDLRGCPRDARRASWRRSVRGRIAAAERQSGRTTRAPSWPRSTSSSASRPRGRGLARVVTPTESDVRHGQARPCGDPLAHGARCSLIQPCLDVPSRRRTSIDARAMSLTPRSNRGSSSTATASLRSQSFLKTTRSSSQRSA